MIIVIIGNIIVIGKFLLMHSPSVCVCHFSRLMKIVCQCESVMHLAKATINSFLSGIAHVYTYSIHNISHTIIRCCVEEES